LSTIARIGDRNHQAWMFSVAGDSANVRNCAAAAAGRPENRVAIKAVD
jgi:hypothetical protein